MSVRCRALPLAAAFAIVLALTATPAFAQSGGIKGGFLYSSLSFDKTSDIYDAHNGWTAGIFFGSKKDKSVGLQGELNLVQKGGDDGTGVTSLYYLQVPVLLRVTAGGTVKAFAIVGPSFDVKIAEKSPDLAVVQDWNGIDVGFMAGAGFEIGRLVLEGRGTWGMRNIAKSVTSPLEAEKLTSKTFALQAGFRFK